MNMNRYSYLDNLNLNMHSYLNCQYHRYSLHRSVILYLSLQCDRCIGYECCDSGTKFSSLGMYLCQDFELQLMTFRVFVESTQKTPVKRRRMHSSSDSVTQEVRLSGTMVVTAPW